MTLPRRIGPEPAHELATDADWNSEALTRVIPQASGLTPQPAAAPPAFSVLRASLALREPAPACVPAPAIKQPGLNPVRAAIYVLVPVLLGLCMLRLYRPHTAPAQPGASLTSAPSALPSPAAPLPRPLIETRTVDTPTAKQAASAFARGNYREALAQYRGLARKWPDEVAYRSLIAILERRLAPKPSGE